MKRKRRYGFAMMTSIVILVLICVLLPTVKPIIQQNQVRYIIDAGHGLPDGGAVAVDGTMEQLLNLLISKKLFSLFSDGEAMLTRASEQGLSIVDGSIRDKKISDMKQRVEISTKHNHAMWVSIHMNTYPNSSVYGCQVFYKKDDATSKEIALKLQKLINEQLQPDHTKEVKTIPEDLYLFKNITNSAILIECGFISNPTELEKLKSEAYQNKLAQLIYQSVAQ